MRIRELRLEFGMTQEELGKRIGQTKSNISKYERGTLQPSIETLNQLSDIFNVSIDYLVGRSNVRNLKDVSCLLKQYDDLSEESKKELEKYIHLLKIKDQVDKGKEEQSSALEKKA